MCRRFSASKVPAGKHLGGESTGLLVSGVILDEPGQLGAGADLGMRDEAGRVLLHEAVQRGLLAAVAFVVDRGAVRRPPPCTGLPADGSHDGFARR